MSLKQNAKKKKKERKEKQTNRKHLDPDGMTVRLSSCVQGMREKNTDSISNEEILVKHMPRAQALEDEKQGLKGLGNWQSSQADETNPREQGRHKECFLSKPEIHCMGHTGRVRTRLS